MGICIIEFSATNHYSQIQSWIDINSYNKVHTYIFTTKNIYSQLKPDGLCKFFFKEDHINSIFFIFSACKFILKNKIFAINILSIQSKINFLNLLPLLIVSKNKLYISIHDCGKWFTPKYTSKFNLKYLYERIFITLYKSCAIGFFVNSMTLKNYIRNHVNTHKPIYVLPFSLYSSDKPFKLKPTNIPITITVPGPIDTKRRVYDGIISLAEKYKEINLVLLGRKMDDQEESVLLYERVRKITNIKTFTNYINETEFDLMLDKTDILFNEIIPTFTADGYYENYGLTKDSGITYLMIRKSLPAIINSEYKHDNSLSSSTVYFNNYDHLEQLINNYIKSPLLIDNLKSEAKMNSLLYVPSKVSSMYLTDFYNNIDKIS